MCLHVCTCQSDGVLSFAVLIAEIHFIVRYCFFRLLLQPARMQQATVGTRESAWRRNGRGNGDLGCAEERGKNKKKRERKKEREKKGTNKDMWLSVAAIEGARVQTWLTVWRCNLSYASCMNKDDVS